MRRGLARPLDSDSLRAAPSSSKRKEPQSSPQAIVKKARLQASPAISAIKPRDSHMQPPEVLPRAQGLKAPTPAKRRQSRADSFMAADALASTPRRLGRPQNISSRDLQRRSQAE